MCRCVNSCVNLWSFYDQQQNYFTKQYEWPHQKWIQYILMHIWQCRIDNRRNKNHSTKAPINRKPWRNYLCEFYYIFFDFPYVSACALMIQKRNHQKEFLVISSARGESSINMIDSVRKNNSIIEYKQTLNEVNF